MLAALSRVLLMMMLVLVMMFKLFTFKSAILSYVAVASSANEAAHAVDEHFL